MPAEVPPHWNVYFIVDDTDKAVEQIKSLGGELVLGPMDIEPGRFAVVGDDQGAHFNVITMTEGVRSS
jgi:predicted enzyme related to lactoylglutathione lyase